MAHQRSPPYLDCQAGSASTDASGDATVSFPRSFSGTPRVFLQGVDPSYRGIVLDVVSKSRTGFTVKARRVTGITSGSAGSHSHSTGGPSSTATPVNNVYYATNTGGPSATASYIVASAVLYADAITGSKSLWAASSQNGPTDTAFIAVTSTATRTFLTNPTTYSIPTSDHTHPMGTITVERVTVASGTHTHSTNSAGSHTHTVDAPVLSVSFDWFAVLV